MTKEDLIEYFKNAPEQKPPFTFMPGTKVIDYKDFLSTHLNLLQRDEHDMNSPVALRLLAMKKYIESK